MPFPYATSADLLARYDSRVIAKYASDTGIPIPPAGLATNARIVAALKDASGLINAACIKGRRYPSSVLESLASDPNKGALLIQMTCALAMGAILANRVSGVDEIDELAHGYKRALEILEDLRGGGLVFDIDATLTATLPTSAGPRSYDPSRPSVWNPMFGEFFGGTWRPY